MTGLKLRAALSLGISNQAGIIRNLQAATTTAVLLIPQAMAYALLAEVPPIHGLYASVLPLATYAIFGRSKQLSPGLNAMDSLLVGAALLGMHLQDDATRAATAALLALMVAGIQLVFGLLRAGIVVNFVSRPVISGFTSAAALTVALSQAPHLFGFSFTPQGRFDQQVVDVLRNLPELHLPTTLMAAFSIALLWSLKRLVPRAPAPLIVVVIGILLSAIFGFEELGVKIVGTIPAGLPSFVLPPLDKATVRELLPTAFTVAFVGYMTIISIGQTFAQRNRYRLNPTRELIALGASNLASGLTHGLPVSGSFSRSAVNAAAGASSPKAQFMTVAWVALTLIFLTPLLAPMPIVTLASVIVVAVIGLVDIPTVRRLLKVKRTDMWLLIITFAATLFIGIEHGIPIGVGASLLILLTRLTRPNWVVLGQLPGRRDYRNVKVHDEAITTPGVTVIRIDAQFYFGNVAYLQDVIRGIEESTHPPLRVLVLEASSLNQLDSSANDTLAEIISDLNSRGIEFRISSVKGHVAKVMRASGLFKQIGEDKVHFNVHEAVQAAKLSLGLESSTERQDTEIAKDSSALDDVTHKN